MHLELKKKLNRYVCILNNDVRRTCYGINLCALTVFWQAHKKLEGLDKTEAIEKAIELSKETLTYEGLFFNVKVHTVARKSQLTLSNSLIQTQKITFLMSNCLTRVRVCKVYMLVK